MKLKGLFRSQLLFWKDGHKDDPALEIGDVLDKASNLRGVGCDGALNGLKYLTTGGGEPTGDLRMGLEKIAGITYLIVKDCTGAEVARFQQV